MKRYFLSYGWIILLGLVAACGQSRYVHSAFPVTIPEITDKGDAALAVAYVNGDVGGGTTNGERNSKKTTIRGVNMQATYGLSNRVWLAASLNHNKEVDVLQGTTTTPDRRLDYRRNSQELMAGYFLPLDKLRNVNLGICLGVGVGNQSIQEPTATQTEGSFFRNNHMKYFLQPSFSVSNRKYLSFGLAYKANAVQFNNAETDYSIYELEHYTMDSLSTQPFYYKEFSAVVALSHPRIRGVGLVAGITASNSLLNDRFLSKTKKATSYPLMRHTMFHVGLQLKPRLMFKKGNNP